MLDPFLESKITVMCKTASSYCRMTFLQWFSTRVFYCFPAKIYNNLPMKNFVEIMPSPSSRSFTSSFLVLGLERCSRQECTCPRFLPKFSLAACNTFAIRLRHQFTDFSSQIAENFCFTASKENLVFRNQT